MKRPKVVLGAALLVGGVLLSGAAGTSRIAAESTPAPGPSAPSPGAAAPAAALRVRVTSVGGSGEVTLVVACEAPATGGDGIEVSAATAVRHAVAVAPGAPGEATFDGRAEGSTCTVVQADPQALRSVSGGDPVLDSSGTLTGVRATLGHGLTTVELVDDLSGARLRTP